MIIFSAEINLVHNILNIIVMFKCYYVLYQQTINSELKKKKTQFTPKIVGNIGTLRICIIVVASFIFIDVVLKEKKYYN